MALSIVDVATRASGAENEDRAGNAGHLVWVIDGATDAVEKPLTGAVSDASWFAHELDQALRRHAADETRDLAELFAIITPELAQRFDRAAKRPPAGRHEHPSASAMIVRECPAGLDWISIGDCTLLARNAYGVVRLGTDREDAGDKALAVVIRQIHATQADPGSEAARAEMWARIRSGRKPMNMPDGYGVWSITEPPRRFMRSGVLPFALGETALLASDGLLRLVDVFRTMTEAELFARANRDGLDALIDDVRTLELADADTTRFPRAKISDDATGLLLRRT